MLCAAANTLVFQRSHGNAHRCWPGKGKAVCVGSADHYRSLSKRQYGKAKIITIIAVARLGQPVQSKLRGNRDNARAGRVSGEPSNIKGVNDS